MKKNTIFDSSTVAPACAAISKKLFDAHGWEIGGEVPKLDKYVLIAAPHTSNWDFYYMVLIAFQARLKIYWMGKDSLFKGVLGPFSRWFGGIAIERNTKKNTVEQTIQAFHDHDQLVMVIPPEGTRNKVSFWKSGFYHIAHGANVPIVLGYLDFGRKRGGFGPIFHPTGDYEKDLKEIQAYYKDNGITGHKPSKFSN